MEACLANGRPAMHLSLQNSNDVNRYALAAFVKSVQDMLEIGDTTGSGLFTASMLRDAPLSPLMDWLGERINRTDLLAVGVGF